MSESNDKSAAGDAWSHWVLKHRHAGDAAYQAVLRQMIGRIRDRVLDGARLAPKMTIADIGTGDGLIGLGAIDRVGSSLRAIFTDISAPLLEHAKQAATKLGVAAQCTFVEGTAEQLMGIADASVDVAMTRAVLAYVPDKAAAMREIFRVTRPGGRISIAEPIFRDRALEVLAMVKAFGSAPIESVPSFPHLLLRWKTAQFPSTEEAVRESPIASFTERDLVRLARDAGFGDVHLELHIDERTSSITSWDVFINTSPHPLAPPLQEIMAAQFSPTERLLFERVLRPQVESGQAVESDSIAYMTAVRPAR